MVIPVLLTILSPCFWRLFPLKTTLQDPYRGSDVRILAHGLFLARAVFLSPHGCRLPFRPSSSWSRRSMPANDDRFGGAARSI